jgi:hypothetical protein
MAIKQCVSPPELSVLASNKYKHELSLQTTSVEMSQETENPMWKTKSERAECSKAIIKQLSDLDLTVRYPAVALLMRHIRDYINEGKRIKISIPFPEVNRRICGVQKGRNKYCS